MTTVELQRKKIELCTKNIILMRHFSATQDHFGISDKDRSLSEDSKKEIDFILEQGAVELENIDLILCSKARRTKESLEAILPLCSSKVNVSIQDSLYHASVDELLEEIQLTQARYNNILIIAHNPGLGYFLQKVQKENYNAFFENVKSFPTGALSIFSAVSKEWKDIRFQNIRLNKFLKYNKTEQIHKHKILMG